MCVWRAKVQQKKASKSLAMAAVSSRVSDTRVPVMQSNVEQLLLDLQAMPCLTVCQTRVGRSCNMEGIWHCKGAARATMPPAALDMSLHVAYASWHVLSGSSRALAYHLSQSIRSPAQAISRGDCRRDPSVAGVA